MAAKSRSHTNDSFVFYPYAKSNFLHHAINYLTLAQIESPTSKLLQETNRRKSLFSMAKEGHIAETWDSDKGRVTLLMLLLSDERALDWEDSTGATPLLRATFQGDVTIVRHLLARKFDMGSRDIHGRRPLLIAAARGDLAMIELFLRHGANFNQRDIKGETALMVSVQEARIPCVRYILENRLDRLDTTDNYGQNSISMAAKFGHLDVLEVLKQQRANFIHCDQDGSTPLTVSTKHGKVDCAKYFLKNSLAHFDDTDLNGHTALSTAAEHGCTDLIQLFEEHKADLTKRSKDGTTLPMLSAKNGHLDCVKYLLKKHSILIDVQDSAGRTALRLAIIKGREEVSNMLLESDAHVWDDTMQGWPWYLKDELDSFYRLLNYPKALSPRLTDDFRRELLAWTANLKDHKLADALSPFLFARLPAQLHGLWLGCLACEKGHLPAVKLLYILGVKLSETVEGTSPFKLALKHRHRHILEFLVEASVPNAEELSAYAAPPKAYKLTKGERRQFDDYLKLGGLRPLERRRLQD